jgi:transcriptional regulator with XRE-family HTH domain
MPARIENAEGLKERSYMLMIGERLRTIRDSKNLSQGDIEKRTGLLRCYTSRVENGHTVPSLDTLAKYSQALEIPMYQLFYEGNEPKVVKALKAKKETISVSDRREVELLGRRSAKLSDRDKGLVRLTVSKLTNIKA